MYDGKVNGRGENRLKFLKEMQALSPLLHAAGVVQSPGLFENRESARNAGFKNVEEAVNKRMDRIAEAKRLREDEIMGVVNVWLFGGKLGDTEYKRLLPAWAKRFIYAGKAWPLWLFGYSIRTEQGRDMETMYDSTTIAVYRFWRLKFGQQFIWGGIFHAGSN